MKLKAGGSKAGKYKCTCNCKKRKSSKKRSSSSKSSVSTWKSSRYGGRRHTPKWTNVYSDMNKLYGSVSGMTRYGDFVDQSMRKTNREMTPGRMNISSTPMNTPSSEIEMINLPSRTLSQFGSNSPLQSFSGKRSPVRGFPMFLEELQNSPLFKRRA